MRHRLNFNKLGLKASHRRALIKNMVMSLFKYERIRTTRARAIEVRRKAEKLITRAKKDSVHNRRLVWKDLREKAVLVKLFTVIAPRFLERKGGYTRILKLGKRRGDAADLVLLELVERTETSASDDKKAKKKESKRSKEVEKVEDKETEKKEAVPASSS